MSKKPLAIVILAAGKGTRMNSDTPKVLRTLAGLPMISWLIHTAEVLNPEKIIVVVGKGMKDLEATVKPHETAVQEIQNGTGGALQAAMPKLKGFKGDVLVLLGDTPLISLETMRALVETREEAGMAVLGTALQNPSGYGRLIMRDDGSLERIVEEKDAGPHERAVQFVNAGGFCIDGGALPGWLAQLGNNNAQKEYYLTDLPEIAAREGVISKVCLTMESEEVQGCNTPADLAALEMRAQNVIRTNMMNGGVKIMDPASVYFHCDTKIAPGVVIEPHVFFGPGVEIGAGCHVKAFSHLEGAKIGKNVTLGPFARLRPGTEIMDDARIGNFVEVKKSRVGKRSKVNHLAYVGDTTMGDDVNFSAGAITVNYDGFEKHQTIIGKGVMIGSNANLVAPISIDDGAFIAAGSTVTEDVPKDALSIARDTASIREGWAKEYRKRKEAVIKKLKRKKKAS